ncbi:MAG: transporter substrate-binding domain-containing protein [Planctomycetota bacterium]|nr:transporter substrate-binding domain-containing protein [Planctomycetota bacterium]
MISFETPASMRVGLRSLALASACFVILLNTGIATSDETSKDADSKPLVVCAVPTAMPRTGRASDDSPQGLDVAVAQLVAKQLGRQIEWHWCASASCSWSCIRDGRCDLVIGVPHGSGPSRELAWSVPYAGSRFGLVVHKDSQGIKSVADLDGKRVGIVSGTVALSSEGHTAVQFKTREQLVEEFVDQQLDAAFVDDDFAAWYLHEHQELPLRRVPQYVPRERWNMAFAVRAKDKPLLADINRALRIVLSNGQVSKAFSEQGVGYRAPFANTDGREVVEDSWKRIRERGELVVSMDPANLPYSSGNEDQPGLDVEFARALAQELDLKLRLEWIDVQRETAIGELLDRECDLAFGAAIEPAAVDDEEELAGKVIYSKPYYGTGYLLITRKDGPSAKSLAELKGDKSRRLGTDAGSVADYHLRQRGYQRRLFRTQLAVLKSLQDGGIDYAYVWANAGWVLHTTPEFELEVVPGYAPEDHWNIAIAMRRGDDELKRHVDAAIQTLVSHGTVSSALSRYHVPHFSPFGVPSKTDSQSVPPKTGTIHRQPTDRGLEPQMQRRQQSKTRYAGLERLRSAGELVVGLDHNNLPFSTAHPEASGLDYEIAGLLAEQLGVSMRVYWGYSSHDSYPSKLANKKFCDVMLGVMPDDRFGKRVIYSKPYYHATYQLAVRADRAAPATDAPVAAQRGLAVRGLDGRDVRAYSTLEAILSAVAKDEVQTGYVISGRGHWLAEQHWPGELKFIGGGSEAVDRFPICAAVRKEDADLKAAIDEALDELDKSGKLAEVFSRWKIPAPAQTRGN